jgi:hypothetical protein
VTNTSCATPKPVNSGPRWNADRDPPETISAGKKGVGRSFSAAVISLRRSCASKDGCSTESDVRLLKDR